MSDEPELLKARDALIHALANSIAIIAANVQPLHPYTTAGAEPLLMLLDMEQSAKEAEALFKALRREKDPSVESHANTINALASIVTVFDLNLKALERHVHRRDGRNILGDMQEASARATKQFAALRRLL